MAPGGHDLSAGTFPMRVFLTGGTGLIGRQLVRSLIDRGDQPVILTRHADKARLKPSLKGAEIVQGDPNVNGNWDRAVDGCDAVINLAGHNIFAQRWNAEVKQTIRDSRVHATENVVGAISRATAPPKVLVQASAIGYYGTHGDEELTESSPPGDDFMAHVCREWEDAAKPVESLGARLATIRTGIVLAKGEGALGTMTPIFKLGPGTPVGNEGKLLSPAKGRQWMSWIHLDDIVGIYLLALDKPEATGPINGTAPNPRRNVEFSRILSKTLWKPYAPWRVFLPFGPPDLMLQLALGEVAEVVTKGQKVLPKRARELGYTFRFSHLEDALRSIFRGEDSTTKQAEPAPATVGSGQG